MNFILLEQRGNIGKEGKTFKIKKQGRNEVAYYFNFKS